VRLEAGAPPDQSRASSPNRTLFGLQAEALAALMVEAGEPAWRSRQLAEALYRQRITELNEITTLPKSLPPAARRRRLAGRSAGNCPGLPIFGRDGALLVRGQAGRWVDRRDSVDARGR